MARIAKAHALGGEVTVDLYTDFPERLPGRELLLSGCGQLRQVRVEALRGLSGQRAIIKLAGVDAREQAEELRGCLLSVRREDIPDLPAGEYYDFQIVGLRVVTSDGRDLGEVVEVLHTGANEVYLTEQVAVPAVAQFVKHIDLDQGQIVVEGLDELL